VGGDGVRGRGDLVGIYKVISRGIEARGMGWGAYGGYVGMGAFSMAAQAT
jgi:hypothetical protein